MQSRGAHAEGSIVILDVFWGESSCFLEGLLQAVSSWSVLGELLKHFCFSALQKETNLLILGPC